MESDISFIAQLEWEILRTKYEIDPIEGFPNSEFLPIGTEKVEIYRDEAYSINMKVTGRLDNANEINDWVNRWNPREESEGFIPPLEFDISTDFWNYQLVGCYYNGSQSFPIRRNTQTSNRAIWGFEAIFSVSRICRKSKHLPSDENAVWLTEWYLNAPRKDFYSQLTTRDFSVEYRRNRRAADSRNFIFPVKTGGSVDHIFVELDNLSFLIQDVPESLIPDYSKCLGIEYREEWGGIPESNKRQAIAEIVSFIAGRQLLNVGYTKFQESGYVIEEVAIKPSYSFNQNIINLCKLPDSSPVKLVKFNADNGRIEYKTEKVLQNLVPKYLSLRDKLQLDKILQAYWLFQEIPIGRNLPVLAAGIETLAEKFLAYKNIKKSGEYISKDRFKSLLKEEITSIEKKLKNEPQGQRMIEKIKSAYSFQLGSAGTIKAFFEEIQLKIGDLEKEAMQVRNDMTHSTIDFSNNDDRFRMYKLTETYRTLFNRIMLKILEFEDMYIDYSTFNLPERHISEPAGSSPDEMM